MFMAAGAAWIALKAPKPSTLQARAVGLRLPLQVAALVLFLAVSVYGHFVIQPAMDPALGIVRWLFAILAVGGIVASIVLARRGEGSDKGAFLAQSVSAFCLVGLLAASMFPNLVVASAGSVGPSITLMSAASSELSLMWMTIITCVGLPLVLVYHVIIYRTFRGARAGRRPGALLGSCATGAASGRPRRGLRPPASRSPVRPGPPVRLR